MNKLLSIVLVFTFVACNSTSDSPGSGNNGGPNGPAGVVDKDLELVTHVTQNIVDPKVKSFTGNAESLVFSIQSACGAEAVKVSQLRQEWALAMMDLHYLEAIAFGPLSGNNKELKSHLYSWPEKASGAVVDAQMNKLNNNPETYKFNQTRMAGKGLDAFEHILFSSLKDEEFLSKGSAVCPYLMLISDDFMVRSQDFKQKWQAELDYIASPDGQTSLGKYIAEITNSLYFADKVVKDRKIAAALGIETVLGLSCELGTNCQHYLEHQDSLMAKEAIVVNIHALSDVITGFSPKSKVIGFGYSDYLKALDAEEEVVSFSTEIRKGVGLWENLPSGKDFYDSVVSYNSNDCSVESLCNSYKEIQIITTWMKRDFITNLNTGLPGNVHGDND